MHQSPIPKTNIIELQLATDDNRKYISPFRLSFETLIDQKHHFSLLFYVQQLHKKIALLERKIALNTTSSISGYRDSSLANDVYTNRKDIVASITSPHVTKVVGELFHTRKFCNTQVRFLYTLVSLEYPCLDEVIHHDDFHEFCSLTTC